MTKPKIITLAASFRGEKSLNQQLLTITRKALEADADLTDITYADCDGPTYKDNGETLPKGAKLLADALLAHDGIVIATPEYNWSIPGGLKNLVDWLSVDKRGPLNGKVALLMCASTSSRGGISGLQQLRTALQVLGCWVYPHLVSIGSAHEHMKNVELAKQADRQYLSDSVRDFLRATEALHAHH